MYATMGAAGTGIVLFPYLTWVVMRMRRVRDRNGTKLAIGTMVQFFAFAASFKCAAKLEQTERTILEQYVSPYLISGGQLVYIDAMKSSNHKQLEHLKE
jgi:glucose uptake protein GlcU